MPVQSDMKGQSMRSVWNSLALAITAHAIIAGFPLTYATIPMMPLLVSAPITKDCGDA